MGPAFKARYSGKRGSFELSSVKTSTGGGRRPPGVALPVGKGFRRGYYRNGVLTIEHIRGTQRVFFSFHYKADAWRVSQIKQMRKDAATTSASADRVIRLGQVGVTLTRKERRGKGLQGAWEIRRLRIGRIWNKETWREMDGRSVESNEWQKIVQGGEEEIQKWINKQMKRKSGVVVFIGSGTAGRKWINYEIKHAWAEGKGLLGVYIHNLVGNNQAQSQMGRNPFDYVPAGERKLSEIVRVYDPPFKESKQVFDYIRKNLDSWIEEAIEIRRAN